MSETEPVLSAPDKSNHTKQCGASQIIPARIFYAQSQRGFRAPALTPGAARVAALRALQSDESREWRVFPTQGESFSYCDDRMGLALRTWAFEFDNGGRRKFVAASYSTFWRFYSRQLRRLVPTHFYEVVREAHAAKLYLDLEFLIQVNPDRDGDTMTNSVIDACFKLAAVGRSERPPCEQEESYDHDGVVILDSTTEKKFSRHVIFNKITFHDNVQMGDFMRRVVDHVRINDVDKMMVLKDGETGTEPVQVPFVDLGVYTRNRCFRLVGSSKFGKKARLTFAGRSGPRVSVSREEFYNALVCNVPQDAKLLGTPVALSSTMTCTNNAVKRVRGLDGLAVSVVTDRAASPYPRLDEYIRSIVQPANGGIYGVTVLSSNDTVMYAIKGGYKYCAKIGRHHKSNNVILIADLRFKLMSQKCFDPDCHGFRSQPWSIPPCVFQNPDDACFHELSNSIPEDDVSDEALLHMMENFERSHDSNGDLDDRTLGQV